MVFQLIEQSLASEPALQGTLKPFRGTMARLDREQRHLLILDTHSVKLWPTVLLQWQSRGDRAVLLVYPGAESITEKLCGVYHSVYGIVSMSSNILSELPRAVCKVVEGELWISPDILAECVKQTKLHMSQMSDPDPRFTAREDQILRFLMRGFSNKQIAAALRISERTVKFHVSNVLHKSQIGGRRELLYVEHPALSVDGEASCQS